MFLILAWLMVSGLVVLAFYSSYRLKAVVAADYVLQDRVLEWMPPPPPLENVVFLGIDEASLNVFEDDPAIIAQSRPLTLMTEPFPWSREVWALAIKRLTEAGARVVVLDLVLRGPRDGDEVLSSVLEEVGDRVVLACSIEYPGQFQGVGDTARITFPSETILPQSEEKMPGLGYVNFWTDFDGVVRRIALHTTLQGAMNQKSHPDSEVWNSLSSEVLKKMNLGERMIGDQSMWQIPMMDNIVSAYPMVSLYEIFWPSLWKRNYGSGEFFRDKVVVIGPAAALFQDNHTTPLGDMAGPLLHMNAFTAAAQGGLYRRAEDVTNILITLLVGLLLSFCLTRVHLPLLTILVLTLMTVLYCGVWGVAFLW